MSRAADLLLGRALRFFSSRCSFSASMSACSSSFVMLCMSGSVSAISFNSARVFRSPMAKAGQFTSILCKATWTKRELTSVDFFGHMVNYCILKSDGTFLFVVSGGLNHGCDFGDLHVVRDRNFFEPLSPLLKILSNGRIQGCLALFFLCRGNLTRCLLSWGEFSPWFGEGLHFRTGIPLGPGGVVGQWHDRGGRS